MCTQVQRKHIPGHATHSCLFWFLDVRFRFGRLCHTAIRNHTSTRVQRDKLLAQRSAGGAAQRGRGAVQCAQLPPRHAARQTFQKRLVTPQVVVFGSRNIGCSCGKRAFPRERVATDACCLWGRRARMQSFRPHMLAAAMVVNQQSPDLNPLLSAYLSTSLDQGTLRLASGVRQLAKKMV